MLNRRQAMALFGTLSLPASLRDALAQSVDNAGAIAALQGTATGRRGSTRRDLSQGAPIFTGEQVQTAAESRLHAKLGDSTQLYLGEQTRVMIDQHLVQRGGTIHLGAGALMFDRKPPDPKPAVSIRSPFGLLAVRGTTVFCGPSNGVFGVFVQEGEVVVRAAGTSVTLLPGQGTNIAKPGDRPTPAAPWGEARIVAALRSVR